MTTPIPLHAIARQAELVPTLIDGLETAVWNGHPVDQTLGTYYREHREFGSRDRRLYSSLAFSWFRWRGWLDMSPAGRTAKCVMAALLDARELHPTLAFLADKAGLPPDTLTLAAELSLSEKAACIGRWRNISPPTLAHLVPDWLPARLYTPPGGTPSDWLLRCIETFQQRPPTWYRLDHDAEPILRKTLQEIESTIHAHPRLMNAFTPVLSASAPRIELKDHKETRNHVEIQDLASQCVGLLCAPKPDETWWDVCAGAGGKTLQLADLMPGTGRILATDIRSESLDELKQRARYHAVESIKIRHWDGVADPAPGRLYHGVLVDAPCSGIGTWNRNPDARWRSANEKIDAYAAVQNRLIRLAADKVRPGGKLIYATCTLTHAENNDVVESFLKDRTDFVLDAVPHPLTGEPTDGHVWIWPWQGDCNGMYMARLKRV